MKQEQLEQKIIQIEKSTALNESHLEQLEKKIDSSSLILEKMNNSIAILAERTIRFDEKFTRYISDLDEIKKNIKEKDKEIVELKQAVADNKAFVDRFTKISTAIFMALATATITTLVKIFFKQ